MVSHRSLTSNLTSTIGEFAIRKYWFVPTWRACDKQFPETGVDSPLVKALLETHCSQLGVISGEGD